MDRIWTDPRDGKEWRVHFTETWNGAMWGPSVEPSDAVAWFYPPGDPGTEILSADLRRDEDLDAMTDQELMHLLDEAKKGEG